RHRPHRHPGRADPGRAPARHADAGAGGVRRDCPRHRAAVAYLATAPAELTRSAGSRFRASSRRARTCDVLRCGCSRTVSGPNTTGVTMDAEALKSVPLFASLSDETRKGLATWITEAT